MGGPDLVRTRGHGAPPPSLPPTSGGFRNRPGEVISGKYHLVSPIGRGGMGEVWLATHESLKTEVAIKFSDEGVRSDPTRGAAILERFLFEARVSARLGARTKHIVAVLDAGTHSGLPYLVMEYVRGRTLDDELDEKGPMMPERLASILDQIGDALDVAHSLGVIHRDIKPTNVMLAQEENSFTVKVTDFGVAKVIRPDLVLDRPKLTPANALIGSPAYMSPEQMRTGTPMDHRSDLWSLGILVYEALTNHLPFNGRTVADLIISITTQEPTPISKHRPELGSGFNGWLNRALAKDPARRFESARAMADAFRGCMAAAVQHSRRRMLLAGVLALGVGAAAGGVFVMLRRSRPALPPPVAASQSAVNVGPSVGPSGSPLVEPLGPAVPSGAPAGSAASAIPPASAAPPTTPASAVSAAADTDAKAQPTASVKVRAPRPTRKEIDPSEIQ